MACGRTVGTWLARSDLGPWIGIVGAAFALSVGEMSSVGAQEDARARFTLTGRVVDSSQGVVMAGALVRLNGVLNPQITDSLGIFTFDGIEPGLLNISVSQLGYLPLDAEVRWAGQRPLRLELVPDPLILEGMTVQLDRLAQRRKRLARSIRYLSAADIQIAAAGDNAYDFVIARAGFRMFPCNRQGSPQGVLLFLCARIRNKPVNIRLYVDDVRIMVGMIAFLESYYPKDFYTMEIIESCGMIRLYTRFFVENVGQSLPPIHC